MLQIYSLNCVVVDVIFRVTTYMFFCLFRFKAVAAKSKLDLVNEGFTEFTIEDFHNTVSFLHKKKYIIYC